MRRAEPLDTMKLSRTDDPELTQSVIAIKHPVTGADIYFNLARTGPELDAGTRQRLRERLKRDITKRDMQKKRTRYSGGTSIVKQAERELAEGATVDDGLPTKLAVKIYDPATEPGVEYTREEQITLARRSAEIYNAIGQFATWFEQNGKVYLVTEWHGDNDLSRTMEDPAHYIKHTSTEIAAIFYRLLHRINRIYKITGQPISDLKPENLIPIFNREGKLVDLALIDIESFLLDRPGVWTPKYQFSADIQATLSAGKTCMVPTFKTDSHALATTLAMASDLLTNTAELRVDLENVDVFHRPGKTPLHVHRYNSWSPRHPAGPVTDRLASQAIRAMYNALSRGVLPIDAQLPLPVKAFLLQQDCRTVFSYVREKQRAVRAATSAIFHSAHLTLPATTRFSALDEIKKQLSAILQTLTSTASRSETHLAALTELRSLIHTHLATDKLFFTRALQDRLYHKELQGTDESATHSAGEPAPGRTPATAAGAGLTAGATAGASGPGNKR